MQKALRFIKREPVLCAAALAALLSMCFVPPSAEYLSYLDFRVLSILFSLMAVVEGAAGLGLFRLLAQRLLLRAGSQKKLIAVLTMLCFWGSMLITNDVALLTFVPLSLLLLRSAGQRAVIFTVTLQTIAANLGSMLTPVGNPQNLYLYSHYQMDAGSFFALLLPVGGASLLLILAALLFAPAGSLTLRSEEAPRAPSPALTVSYCLLFGFCLLGVFRVVPYEGVLAAVAAGVFVLDRSVYRRLDYGLLATFACFFVFVGNLGNVEAVKAFLASAMEGREVLLSVLLSQGISNVPAALMLSGFTERADALLLGTNVGGLGTLIASLASLISFRLYARSEGGRPGKYLLWFTLANLAFLALLLPLALFLGERAVAKCPLPW